MAWWEDANLAVERNSAPSDSGEEVSVSVAMMALEEETRPAHHHCTDFCFHCDEKEEEKEEEKDWITSAPYEEEEVVQGQRQEKQEKQEKQKKQKKKKKKVWPMNIKKKSLYKTEMCEKWLEYGTCPYSEKCLFAHGRRELRKVPLRKKKINILCRNHLSGKCPYGKRCRYIHASQVN